MASQEYVRNRLHIVRCQDWVAGKHHIDTRQQLACASWDVTRQIITSTAMHFYKDVQQMQFLKVSAFLAVKKKKFWCMWKKAKMHRRVCMFIVFFKKHIMPKYLRKSRALQSVLSCWTRVGEAGFLAPAHHGWLGLWVWLVVICYLWPLAGSSCNPATRQPTRPTARDTLQERRWGRGQGAIWETQLHAFAGLTEIGAGNSNSRGVGLHRNRVPVMRLHWRSLWHR